jgi:alpha-tubulin suppressor-like RCC1 family protein
MTVIPHSVVRCFLVAISALGVAGILACTETTEPARRYAVLDDVGQSTWQTVTVGSDHTCGLTTGGDAYCWGDNEYGQLGVAATDTVCGESKPLLPCSLRPVQVQPGTHFASISAGAHHTCAITTDHQAFCWGANDAGQVSAFAPGGPTLVQVPGTFGWAQISAGYSHSCAVRTDGALFCWGANARGELGNGAIANSLGILQVSVAGPTASVSAGQERTCARTTAGAVYCWGAVWTDTDNGFEDTRQQLVAQAVPSAPAMSSLSVGTLTTCGTDLTGIAYCWEANSRGEMGTGDEIGSTVPKAILADVGFVQVSAGIVNSCGVATDGAGYCWGDDSFGQLGISPSELSEVCGTQALSCSTTPRAVFGRQRFIEISAGFGSHACGVTTQHNLYCWGLGVSGQRGDGSDVYAISTPTMVAAVEKAP